METLEITAHGYLASPLTDNIKEMDDGTLVIEDCPIARDGWQQYAVKDLPQEAARDMGVDISNPSASIDLYRPASEVFSPEFIASLNGRPITDNHPKDFVTPETFKQCAQGHITNVRKGDEQLPSGDWPLLADLVIAGEPLLSKVRSGTQREISLGYDYSIRRDGDKICQCDMVGNHIAVVPKGRAGDDVRINDAMPADATTSAETEVLHTAPPEPAALPPEPRAQDAVVINETQQQKEKPKVKSNLLHLLGLGLKARAADAEPEEFAQAAKDVFGELEPKPGKDADPAINAEPDEDVEDKRARDRAHRALDKAMDRVKDSKRGKDTRGRDARTGDADIDGLMDMLGEYLGEEKEEPVHNSQDDMPADLDADPAELEATLDADVPAELEEEEDDEADPGQVIDPSGEEELDAAPSECAHCAASYDAAETNCPECGCKDKKAPANDGRAKDRARAADGAAAALKMLRPFVARSNDKSMKVAFNTAVDSVTKRSRATDATYGRFAHASHARDNAPKRARANDTNDGASGKPDRLSALQEAYNSALKGGK